MRYAVLFALVISPAIFAAEPKKKEDVYVVPTTKDDKLEIKPGEFAKPTVVTSEKEAEKLISDETTRKRILGEVDLKSYDLVVFAWQGSGEDKIDMLTLESFPPQYKFSRAPGRTKDLKQHVVLYAIKKGAKWSVK